MANLLRPSRAQSRPMSPPPPPLAVRAHSPDRRPLRGEARWASEAASWRVCLETKLRPARVRQDAARRRVGLSLAGGGGEVLFLLETIQFITYRSSAATSMMQLAASRRATSRSATKRPLEALQRQTPSTCQSCSFATQLNSTPLVSSRLPAHRVGSGNLASQH